MPVGEMNHVVASAVWSSSASAAHAKTCRRRCGRMAAAAPVSHADATTRAMRRSTFSAVAVLGRAGSVRSGADVERAAERDTARNRLAPGAQILTSHVWLSLNTQSGDPNLTQRLTDEMIEAKMLQQAGKGWTCFGQ